MHFACLRCWEVLLIRQPVLSESKIFFSISDPPLKKLLRSPRMQPYHILLTEAFDFSVCSRKRTYFAEFLTPIMACGEASIQQLWQKLGWCHRKIWRCNFKYSQLCLTGHPLWNVSYLTSFQSSLVSHSSSTITNDLLGTDHTEFFTKIRGSLESAFVRHRWNFAKAYWPLFREMCDSTLTAFSVDLRYSYQQVFWMQPRSPPRKQSVPWSTRLRRSN